MSLKGNSYQVEKNDVLSEALFMTDITSHDDAIRSNGVLQRFQPSARFFPLHDSQNIARGPNTVSRYCSLVLLASGPYRTKLSVGSRKLTDINTYNRYEIVPAQKAIK